MGSNPYPHRQAPHRDSGTGHGHDAQPGAELRGEGGSGDIAQVSPQVRRTMPRAWTHASAWAMAGSGRVTSPSATAHSIVRRKVSAVGV